MDYEPPYAVSPVDRTGLIVIVETLFMSWMIIVSLIRLYMRLAINGPVQLDDLMVFSGSVSNLSPHQISLFSPCRMIWILIGSLC